jgi:hypothetical protein
MTPTLTASLAVGTADAAQPVLPAGWADRHATDVDESALVGLLHVYEGQSQCQGV